MNYLPPQLMKISRIVLPGDVKARMKQPHVVELSESIAKRTGKRPIHLPTVEYPSKELLAGGDRLAAQLLLGYRSVWVQPVSQLTPQERRDIRRDENLHRRVVDRDALIRERVAEYAAEIEVQRAAEQITPRKSPRGEARERVAAELETTTEAIRQAEQRDAANVDTAYAFAAPHLSDPADLSVAQSLPMPVEMYGLPLLTDVEAEEVRTVQDALDSADALLRRTQAVLRGIDRSSPFAAVAEGLGRATHQVAAEVRASRPAAVCPYCKRLPQFVASCSGCKGLGYVAADVMLGVADELKLGGDLATVATGGRLVTYAYALTAKAAVAPKAKKIRIENEAGEELVPATDDGLPF